MESALRYSNERVLIWGKTYPELSKRYAETVCTAGVREDGAPIRLYPVPLRYLDTHHQYSLYDWIDVPICKSRWDSRPESYKVDATKIKLAGHIESKDAGWAKRAEFIFKDPTWQYPSMRELLEAQTSTKHSLGIITPGSIEEIVVKMKPAGAKKEYKERMAAIQDQTSIFLPEYKELGFRPFDLRLRWRCATPCPTCAKGTHNMLVLDWGLMELARKKDWDSSLAKAKLEDLATSGNYDFKLFLGNTKNYQKSFVVVGLWYPKIGPDTGQLGLL